MSIRIRRELVCDGPACLVCVPEPAQSEYPDGWLRLHSTAHIPSGSNALYRASRNSLTAYERTTGSFWLDLCPACTTVFDGHRPKTDGWPGTRHSDGQVQVECECGARMGRMAATSDRVSDGPAKRSERAWWRHLPDELRAYFPPTPTPEES